jgi:hypothetical protein
VSEFAGPDGKPELLAAKSEACPDQKLRTKQVEREARRLVGHLKDDKIALIFQIQVYAFNCANHDEKDKFHIDYVAGGGQWNVPGELQSTIRALEHALSELKKRVQ